MKHYWQLIRDHLGWSLGPERQLEEHLRAAIHWLLRAQEATPDDGVAHSYDLRRRRWHASYPETTGYIIPTLIDYAELFDAPECLIAAVRMADWEIAVQLPDGGVRAGTMDAEVVVPTVFNTGQVLFGFARAYVATREPRFATALRLASDWLVDAQDADGSWRRFPSPFAPGSDVKAYNTRSAFGLVRAWQALGETRWLRAADANAAWALSTALPNGFLPHNCLTANPAPLTHTLAYAMRGLMEVGVATDNSRYLDHAIRMAEAIALGQRADGAVPGRYDTNWQPAATWTCLTGNSQLAINWLRLGRITGERRFEQYALAANRFNMRAQDLDQRDANRAGALKGSHPIDGDYLMWRYPNWATKFFADGLMLQLRPDVDNLG
ncbi:MAG: hypothetical protein V5B40_22020 [Candidatus Accumulibacter meliphilus]|jgi:uncharacterized protein YyaL (SSP411 family)|uniref:hypothetical protein n=1 Tax=Candidatus Accumulibacter meliphilus TaxID=2211374 RepID=UPI002FC3377B